MSAQKTSETVASLNFPSYAIIGVSGRYILVGGGGGAAKTGIKNQFDVFELYHNGVQTVGEKVLSYDVGDYCITNMVGWSGPIAVASKKMTAPTIFLSLGLEEKCVLMKLKPTLRSVKSGDTPIERIPKPKERGHSGGEVRKRRGSEKNAEEGMTERDDTKEEKPKKKYVNTTLRGTKYFSFDTEKVSETETVFKKKKDDEAYQKCCRLSLDHKVLVTGGTDGHLRVWGLPDMNKLKDIKGHDDAVDDVDIKPDGRQIVSVCKPTRECCVWNVREGKKFIQVALQTNGVKYKCFRARYGVVEGDPTKSKLFTISNPVVGTKNPAIVAKWCGQTYAQEKSQQLAGSLGSLALSDDGRYLATGTMGGNVYILIAFSLQQLREIEAHRTFVTGLEWLPTNSHESQMVRGFSDASVLSISCDNSLKIHHIPRRGMVPVWVAAILAALVLFGAFLLASFLGL
ncbi:guanine nucleotide-exchange factor SEC12 [Macrobrachium rosenbergii]|uniref:guanine nucleotide-exchange factor SEC12 n=1 Tax=Macrobrachium rosenbergii TaxID=79674 RepID=UPI0034D5CE92